MVNVQSYNVDLASRICMRYHAKLLYVTKLYCIHVYLHVWYLHNVLDLTVSELATQQASYLSWLVQVQAEQIAARSYH